MDVVAWALYLLAAAGALVAVAYLYRRREMPGRGRTVLAALRWAALALLILLLFDPVLPSPGVASVAHRTTVLLDASLSMALPAAPGDTASRWARAVAEAKRLSGGRDIILFGTGATAVPADSLGGVLPMQPRSELAPALRAASEAGARRVVVLTDRGLEDGAEIDRLQPQLGMDVEVRSPVGGELANRALAEVEAPSWAEAGKKVEIRFGVVVAGQVPDSVTVFLKQDGETLAEARVPTAGAGRVAAGVLEFTPDSPPRERSDSSGGRSGALVRYDIELESGDAVPDDDVRSVYIHVSERPAGVAILSLRPDWEPRFLQPVLEQALGLPVRGYLRAAGDRYVRLGAGGEAGVRASEREVREALAEADLVVIHGLGRDAPAWVVEAAGRARRVLLFPAADAGPEGLPVRLAPVAAGEWYVHADLPASPVAALLGEVRADELPPLVNLRPLEVGGGSWTPLQASRGRRGLASPVVAVGESPGRRWAVALAEGYWRWAFRGGESRQAYRRLWAALGGWLVREERSIAAAAVRPVDRALPRGAPVEWVASGVQADSIAVRIMAADGSVVADTVVVPIRADTAATRALPPGHYTFEARAFAGDEVGAESDGPFTVESYSPEFMRAPVELARIEGTGARGGAGGRARSGDPLHASAWPYMMLVLLLSAEWTLRRRWGLR